jgi:hypothetical protein
MAAADPRADARFQKSIFFVMVACYFWTAGKILERRRKELRQFVRINLLTMIRSAVLLTLMVLPFAVHAAPVYPCNITVARYHLTGDVVNWSLKVPAGQGCIGGLRLNNVVIERVAITSAPRSGTLGLRGSGFLYTAPDNASGEDWFVLSVSGSVKHVPGQSTIKISVSLMPPLPALRAPTIKRSHDGDANFLTDEAGGYVVDSAGRRLRAF